MPLLLRVPALAGNGTAPVETRRVFVEEAIEALPMADPPALLAALSTSVQGLNGITLKPAARISLLELHLPALRYLVDLARRPTMVHSASALFRRRKMSASLAMLAADVAGGYARAAVDLDGRSSLFGGEGSLTLAVQRAAQFETVSALHAFDAYLPVSADVWVQMDRLSRHAAERRLEGLRGDGQAGDEFSMDVDALYRSLVLTALTDPRRLPHGHLWEAWTLICSLADQVVVRSYDELPRLAGVFVLTPGAGNRPALALTEAKKTGIADGARLLDASDMLRTLQSRLESVRASSASDRHGEASLCGRLIRAFGVPPKRHTPRRGEHGKVVLASGLSTVHHFLGGSSIKGGKNPANDEEVVVGEGLHHGSVNPESHAYIAEQWEMDNRGPGGLGVIRRDHPTGVVDVGELTGVNPSSAMDQPWMLGVIRWMSIAGNGDYRAGVQFLGASAMPAMASLVDADRDAGTVALLLPDLRNNGAGTSIIVPTGVFSRGCLLYIRTDKCAATVRVDGLLESTPTFERFGFRVEGDVARL